MKAPFLVNLETQLENRFFRWNFSNFEGEFSRGHNNFHDEMKVSVFMDDIWDFIAMINNSLHFRFSIIAMKKEIIFSVLPFMSMIILFKHDPQSLIAMNRII